MEAKKEKEKKKTKVAFSPPEHATILWDFPFSGKNPYYNRHWNRLQFEWDIYLKKHSRLLDQIIFCFQETILP